MRNKGIIELIKTDYVEDDLKNQIEKRDFRKVYCNELAIGSNEFSNAGQNDLKADKAFQVHSFEYEDESELRYSEKYYRIYRYAENGDKTNLYCQEIIADSEINDDKD